MRPLIGFPTKTKLQLVTGEIHHPGRLLVLGFWALWPFINNHLAFRLRDLTFDSFHTSIETSKGQQPFQLRLLPHSPPGDVNVRPTTSPVNSLSPHRSCLLIPSQLTRSRHRSRLPLQHSTGFLPSINAFTPTLAPSQSSNYRLLALQNASSRLQRFCRLISHTLTTAALPVLFSLTIRPLTDSHKFFPV